jgi:hypothetical protein
MSRVIDELHTLIRAPMNFEIKGGLIRHRCCEKAIRMRNAFDNYNFEGSISMNSLLACEKYLVKY